MIDIKVLGTSPSTNESGFCVELQFSEDPMHCDGLVIQIVSPEYEDMSVLLDDPDAVGALADALRRIERRMREARTKP